MKILQLVNVMLFALVTGVVWGQPRSLGVPSGFRTLLTVAAPSSLVGSVLVSRNRRGTAHFVERAA